MPQQKQLKDKQEENISSNPLQSSSSSIKHSSSDINTVSKNAIKDHCTEEGEYFGASEEEDKSTINNITESVKAMQLGEKQTITLPQQKQINIANSNDQQEIIEQEQCESQYSSNSTNGNNVLPTTNFNETTTDNIINNNDVVNNNKITTDVNKTETINNKNDKKVKESDKIKTSSTISATTDNSNSIKTEDVRDETDRANVLPPKSELENKRQKIENSSKSTTASSDNGSSVTSNNNEETKSQVEQDNDNSGKERSEHKGSDVGESNSKDDATSKKKSFEPLINYNEGQWSPSNPSGKKQYNREQLMQLREAKASRIQPEVKNTSIFSQTNLMPAFASRGNKKVQSMVGGFSGRGSSSGVDGNYQNNYMKQSSMSGRGGGDGHHSRNSGKSIIHLNLSLNQDVKLNEADNAWRPRVLLKSNETQVDPEQKAQREKEELIRRVRGILNKLTPEKFEPLVEEIMKLKIDTIDKMEAVMILVFEKAIDEPNFSVSYASLCHRLINEVKARDVERMESGTKTNLAYFRNALLDKTEREFTQNVTKSNAKEEKLKPIKEKIANCKDPNEKVELEALLDEEERKIRRRSGGTVRFIGELFKISILTGKIIHTCIEALLKDPNNEDMLECLCKLLTTVGQKFEQTPMSKDDKRKYSLDSVIQRMQNIASKNENSKISSRVRFMLQDVIDLRKKKWQSTRNEAPKTMEQIEKEANNEQLSNPYHYMNSMSGGGGSGKRDDRGGRSGNYGGSHSQRGDTGSLKRQQGGMGGSHSQSGSTNSDDTWHVQTGKGNRSLVVDSSKLVGLVSLINFN